MEIEYVKDKDGAIAGYTRRIGWADECYVEITKKSFDELKALTDQEFLELIESGIDDSVKCGYGFYGCRLISSNGKYYIMRKFGGTCD